MIHPQAVVHEDCMLGSGVTVWQFASVLRRSIIGVGGSVGSCAVVDGSRLMPGARIGHGAQLHPGVWAGRNLFLGPGAIVCNDRWPWLGSEFFDLEALIGGANFAVMIGNNVTIGAGAIVLPGVALEDGCVVAAGAVVESNVPAGLLLDRRGGLRELPKGEARMRYAEAC
jgi:UDP-2-acetamido-3-amino-2,3-dideoxy-glucuronate N-acetyltransferase